MKQNSSSKLSKDEKLYYTFVDLEKELGVSVQELRIWEREFGLKANQSTANATKRFHYKEVKKFRKLRYYLIEREYSFEATHKRIDSNDNEEERREELKLKLKNLKDFLLYIKENL